MTKENFETKEGINFEKVPMTNKFTYRDNSTDEHRIIFECMTDSIVDADELYKKATGNDPIKQPHVGCSIERVKR
jgi:hypothetical protein